MSRKVLLGVISVGNPAQTRGSRGGSSTHIPPFQREPSGSTFASDRCPPRCWLTSPCASLKVLPLARTCPAATRALGSVAARRRHPDGELFLQKVVLALASTEDELEAGCASNPTVTGGLQEP